MVDLVNPIILHPVAAVLGTQRGSYQAIPRSYQRGLWAATILVAIMISDTSKSCRTLPCEFWHNHLFLDTSVWFRALPSDFGCFSVQFWMPLSVFRHLHVIPDTIIWFQTFCWSFRHFCLISDVTLLSHSVHFRPFLDSFVPFWTLLSILYSLLLDFKCSSEFQQICQKMIFSRN